MRHVAWLGVMIAGCDGGLQEYLATITVDSSIADEVAPDDVLIAGLVHRGERGGASGRQTQSLDLADLQAGDITFDVHWGENGCLPGTSPSLEAYAFVALAGSLIEPDSIDEIDEAQWGTRDVALHASEVAEVEDCVLGIIEFEFTLPE